MQQRTSIKPIGRPTVHSIPLSEGQRIEVELDAGTVEIRHLEPCDAVSGSVFVGVNEIGGLIAALRAVGKSGGLTR